MIRFTKALVAVAVALTLPSMASAFGIASLTGTGSGASNTVLERGESITFDIIVENDTNVEVFGLDIVVSGIDNVADYQGNLDSNLALTGGAVSTELFAISPGLGFPTGLANSFASPELVHTANLLQPPELVRVGLFGGISFSPITADGQDDTGIGGDLISNGDIHFQVTFTNVGNNQSIQTLNLNFGTDASVGAVAVGQGGSILPFANGSYTLTVIPEPGTALLMGLGLAGLAGVRRR